MHPEPRRNRRLFLQLMAILAVITVASVVFVSQIIRTTEASSGKGSAINISGSLRMQSYVLALSVAESAGKPVDEKISSIKSAVDEFRRRLLSPALVKAIPESKDNSIRLAYDKVKDDFYKVIEPLAQAAQTKDGRKAFLQAVPSFVANVDAFVLDLENELEDRVNNLRLWLYATIFGSILIGLLMPAYLLWSFFKPIHRLSDLASEVRQGNFAVRSPYGHDNEIGELSKSFNFMVEDLSTLYSNLEEKVRVKTADLDKRNETLRLLYRLRSTLDSRELNRETLREALTQVLDYFKAGSISIVFHHDQNGTIQMHTGARVWKEDLLSHGDPVKFLRKHWKDGPEPRADILEVKGRKRTVWQIPICSTEKCIGTMMMVISEERPISEDEVELLKNISSLFFVTLEKTNQQEEEFRLALFEERSTIARELHDSIAQSLAYSKIQLTRLSHALSDQDGSGKGNVQEIIEELKVGVSTAYKQLREVLTTFRTAPQARDFRQQMREILDQFHARSSVPYSLDNKVPWFELSPNQQVHLLQILQEALSNITKHARASHVRVIFQPTGDGSLELLVQDDGVGFDLKDRSGHFGLGIMRERANAIGGKLTIEKNIPKGTQIRLVFQSDS